MLKMDIAQHIRIIFSCERFQIQNKNLFSSHLEILAECPSLTWCSMVLGTKQFPPLFSAVHDCYSQAHLMAHDELYFLFF